MNCFPFFPLEINERHNAFQLFSTKLVFCFLSPLENVARSRCLDGNNGHFLTHGIIRMQRPLVIIMIEKCFDDNDHIDRIYIYIYTLWWYWLRKLLLYITMHNCVVSFTRDTLYTPVPVSTHTYNILFLSRRRVDLISRRICTEIYAKQRLPWMGTLPPVRRRARQGEWTRFRDPAIVGKQ